VTNVAIKYIRLSLFTSFKHKSLTLLLKQRTKCFVLAVCDFMC